MESQRNLLVLALLFVSFLLYQAWVVEKNPQPVATAQTTEQSTTTPSVPSTSNHSADVPASSQDASVQISEQSPVGDVVVLANDQLRLEITLIGGDIIVADLLQHDDELDSGVPFRLLSIDNEFTYIAQSGLIGKQGPDANPKGRPYYTVDSA